MVRSIASGFLERAPFSASALVKAVAQTVGQSRHDLILQLEQVGHVLLETVGPQMRAGFGVDELGVDAHPVLVALHRAFEHVADAEFLADLLGVDALALVGEGGVAGDDEAVADAREFGGEVFGDAVGEIILARIAGEIGEGEHDDGEMRGLRRFRQAAAEQVPAARGGQKQKGGDRGEPANARPSVVSARCLAASRRRRPRLRLGRLADFQRIDPDRLGDVLELGRAEITDLQIEPRLHLPVGVLGEADRAGLGDALKPRGDIDAVAHQIAVALLDDVAEMDADAKLDAPVRRHAGVALDQAVLDFDRAAHRVDDAAELDDAPSPVRLTMRP